MNNTLRAMYENLYTMMAQVDNLDRLGLSPNQTLLRMIEKQEEEIKELKERMEANDI